MKDELFRRLEPVDRSFFLFGARGTGKSTWLRQKLPEAIRFDLLRSSVQLELMASPDRLEALIGDRPSGTWILLDEVQKAPGLLAEVHRLIEEKNWRFALCGSSARKLRRGGADLLAGRALTLTMEPFSFAELGDRFHLDQALEWGMLPVVWSDLSLAPDILSAYLDTYLREEIREEGAVRNLAPFVRFLAIAGQIHGQALNMQNISRDAGVPRSTTEAYFSVLQDTLVAGLLPAWRPNLKVREAAHPKFYWTDSGVARAATGLLRDPVDRAWKGASLESLIFHELRCYNTWGGNLRPLSYYRTAAGVEIDFIIETVRRMEDAPARVVCIEAKLSPRWDRKWESAMRGLRATPGIEVEKMIGVYTGTQTYRFDDLDVFPVEVFRRRLHAGEIF
ncbi:MAG: AAA family ATPase, partial [Kiritimatiellia bacterium]|nr:AAA family ATPase [Kiritimatiellia bacterium]